MDAERCVCCGRIVPEGTMVCYHCDKNIEREDSGMRIKVLIESFADVNEIVKLASLCEDEVLAYSNQYIVSVKSIMGMYSLNLSKPIEIEFQGDVPDEVKEGIKKFIIE